MCSTHCLFWSTSAGLSFESAIGAVAQRRCRGYGLTWDTPRALLLVDEVGALGSAARHLRGLVGRARESGLAVVLATQGPSDLEAVDRALLPQVLQDTAWQLAARVDDGTVQSAVHAVVTVASARCAPCGTASLASLFTGAGAGSTVA
jgi:hypothetical protein